jgi:hypothetical protein
VKSPLLHIGRLPVYSVDRNTIAQARLNDLEEDLGMTGTDFNTAVSILFVG